MSVFDVFGCLFDKLTIKSGCIGDYKDFDKKPTFQRKKCPIAIRRKKS